MSKAITVKQVGWRLGGEVQVTLWMGDQGTIEMRESSIPLGKLNRKAIHSCINDNGFGVQSIDRASVDVFEEYERSVLVYRTTLQILDPDPKLACQGI